TLALTFAILPFIASAAHADSLGCKREIAKRSAKFVQAKMKALQKCNDNVVNNASAGPCPDATATSKITTAESKFRAAIDKKCGGLDHSCGSGGDDESLASIGWNVGNCP